LRDVVLTTSCPAGSIVTLKLVGSTLDETSATCQTPAERALTANAVANGEVREARFAVSLFQGVNVLSASVVQADNTRRGETLENTLQVDTIPPRILFTFPDNGLDLDIVDADLVADGLQVNARGQVVGIEANRVVTIAVQEVGAGEVVYEAPVTLLGDACFDQESTVGEFSVPVTFATDGLVRMKFTVRDEIGNSVAKDVELIVNTQVPTLALTQPAYTPPPSETISLLTGDAVADGGADVDPLTPGLQYDFVIAVSGATLNGRPGTLFVPNQAPTFFTFNASPQTVRVTLQEGPAIDSFLIDGFFAQVTMANGATYSSPPIKARVDPTPPSLVLASPQQGDVFATGVATTDFVVNVGAGDEAGRTVRVRRTAPTTALVETTTGAAAATVTLDDVPLALGLNTFVIEATDRASAPFNTARQTITIYRATGTATVRFSRVNGATIGLAQTSVGPLATDADGDLNDGFDVATRVAIEATPGLARLQIKASAGAENHFVSTRFVTIPTLGSIELSNVDFTLPSGQSVVELSVLDASLQAASASLTVLALNSDAPRPIEITTPEYEERTNVSALAVTVRANGAAVSDCSLYVDPEDQTVPPGAPRGGVFALSALGTSVQNVALSNADVDGLHTVWVQCLNGGTTVFTQRQLFDLRRSTTTAIAFRDDVGVRLSAGPRFYVNGLATNSASDGSFRHDIALDTNLPDGSEVTLTVTLPSTAPEVLTAVSQSGLVRFRNVRVASSSAPAASDVELLAQAADPYSGGIVSASRTGPDAVRVDVVPPTLVNVTGCPSSIGVFNAFDDPATTGSIEHRAFYSVTNGSGSLTTVVVTPTGTTSNTDAFTGSPATVAVDMSFAVPMPRAVYAISYTASARDDVDNIATVACASTVDPLAANMSLSTVSPDKLFADTGDPLATLLINLGDDDNAGAPGLQVGYLVNAVNVAQGTIVRLCSTAVGLSGTDCELAPGKVIAEGTRGSQSAVFLLGVATVDGSYGLAAELFDPATLRRSVTPAQTTGARTRSFPVQVDSTAPDAPSLLTFAANQTHNDTPTLVRLGANVYVGVSTLGAEGTVVSGATRPEDRLTTSVDVTFAAPLAVGSRVSVSSAEQPSLAASQTLVAPQSTITLPLTALQQGPHALTFTVRGPTGNSTQVTQALLVDLIAPTVSVDAPTVSPITCATVNGCTGGVLGAAVSVDVSDDREFATGCVCVTTANGPCLGANGACVAGPTTQALATGVSGGATLSLDLAEGTNLVAAELSDATGNVVRAVDASRRRYDVDTLVATTGPSLTVTAAGGGDCSSQAQACEIARDNSDPAYWFSSGTYQVQALGAASTACAILGDSCSLRGRLLARRGPTDSFREVFQSNTGVRTGVNQDLTSAFLETYTPVDPAGLERGVVWEVTLEVTDQHGNVQRSPSRFISLIGFGGTLVTLQRGCDTQGVGPGLCNGATQGQALVNPTQFGLRQRKQSAPYRTDLQVELDFGTAPAAAGACVDLYRNSSLVGTTTTSTTNTIELVTFPDVELGAGPDVLEARVSDVPIVPGVCTGLEALQGVQTVGGITTTETLPDVVFAQAWRTTIGVNGGARIPAAVFTGTLANDGDSAAGYQFQTPVAVTVANVGDALTSSSGTLRLLNDQATPLSGSLTTSSNCSTACNVSFTSSVTVPNVAAVNGDASEQLLIAEACNPAGDCVQTTTGALGVAESVRVKADTIAPSALPGVLCVGESYAPTAFAGPASQYTDDASCAAACAGLLCERAQGNVVIALPAAPGNDGTIGGPVADYDVLVAVRETLAPSQADCVSFVNGLSLADRNAALWTDVQKTVQAPGQPQLMQLRHLPLHQRLCVAVLGRDVSGNVAVVDAQSAHLRVLPFLPVKQLAQSYTAFERQTAERPDDELSPSFAPFANGFPGAMIAVPDMDGDGAEEIAIGDATAPGFGFDGSVQIFSSRRTRAGNFAPRAVIAGPSGRAGWFGFALAAGDFNGDGNGDLAIGAPYVASNSIGSPLSGAVYVYYGRYGATIQPTGGDTDPDVLQVSTCGAVTIAPTVSGVLGCPSVIFDSATASTDPFVPGLGQSLAAGSVAGQGVGGAVDLAMGSPGHVASRGAAFIARNSSANFPSQAAPNTAPAVALIVDPLASPTDVTRVSAPCDLTSSNDYVGQSLAIADLDGDGNDDVVVNFADRGVSCADTPSRGYSFFRGGSSLFATVGAGLSINFRNSGTAVATCLAGGGLGTQMNPVGAPDGGAAEWLVCKQGADGLQFLRGANDFFAAPSVCVAPGPAQIVGVDANFRPRASFGVQPQTACGAGAVCVAPGNPMPGAYSAGPYRDVNGDGRTEVMIGDSGLGGSPSRLMIVGYVAGAPERFVLLSELTGNNGGSGLGSVLAPIGNHSGSNASGIATIGITSDFSQSLLWIFQ
jgi:hypothetical protein